MEVGTWQSFAYFWPEVALAASALAVALLAVLVWPSSRHADELDPVRAPVV